MEANHNLTGADLKEWREVQHLSQEELGELLGKSREWIGKLERGERAVSAEIYMTFDRVRREPRFSIQGNQPNPSALDGPVKHELNETGPMQDSPPAIRQELRTLLEDGIKLAGDDIARLGWLLYQAKQHLQPPAVWRISPEDRNWALHKMAELKQKVAERNLAAPSAENLPHAL